MPQVTHWQDFWKSWPAVKNDAVRAYLERRAAQGSWRLETDSAGLFPGGLVIPSLAESASLPCLLQSLCSDHTLAASGLLVVFVVNNREDSSVAEQADNAHSLALLREKSGKVPFPIGIVDASSPGLSLGNKDGGVGLARKLGHDLLLPKLDFSGPDPVIISLDADTLVSPGYSGAIVTHFRSASAGGAVVPFTHLPATGEQENLAIERYELFLRCYVAGLAFAGSPYAFHTVGSAMACRASAYLKCGGMNRRRAGEDFYFLQSLAKTSGVEQVHGAMVYPSPRRSERVPFGTGRAMGMLLDGDKEAVLFYRPESYLLLKQWLELALEGCRERCPGLVDRAGESPHLHGFLLDQGFPAAWDGLLSHNRREERLVSAFHNWFDAFRTMKLFHYLAEKEFPRTGPEDVVGRFQTAWGEANLSMTERLEFLRGVQNM
jgi:hypothetical protein